MTHENAVDDIESKERGIKRRSEKNVFFFCVGKCKKKKKLYFTRVGERETERRCRYGNMRMICMWFEKDKKKNIKLRKRGKKLRIRQNINKI